MVNEPKPDASDSCQAFWEAFPEEQLTWADYEGILSEAGVRQVCVTLIPGRCGSTLLGQLVAQWGCCGTGVEAFNERPASRWRRHGARARDYFVKVARREALGGIFWFQAAPHRHDHLLTRLAPEIPSSWRYSAILRRDIVSQALSYMYAVESGIWHSSSRQYDPASPISLAEDVDVLADKVFDWMGRVVSTEERIREILAARLEGPPLVLFYEDIVRDPREAALRFCQTAGVAPAPGTPPLRQTLSRMQKKGENEIRERLAKRHGDAVRVLEEARAAGFLGWAEGLAWGRGDQK